MKTRRPDLNNLIGVALAAILCASPALADEATVAVRQVRQEGGKLVPQGVLSGKTIYLRAGHGYVYAPGYGWATQRGDKFMINEDLNNADYVNEFLVPMLQAAGAHVVSARELDKSAQMVVTETTDRQEHPADPVSHGGLYLEEGAAGLFSDEPQAGKGFKRWKAYDDYFYLGENPFEDLADTTSRARLMKSASSESARAILVPKIKKTGSFYVYLAHVAGADRASDVHVTVNHAGGQAHFLVDQRRQGQTWVVLGRFPFRSGANKQSGSVVISNASQDAGSVISLDAVRVGGGKNWVIPATRAQCANKKEVDMCKISTHIRADEAARYHAQFCGIPKSYYQPNSSDRVADVVVGAKMAQYLHNQSPNDDAIYLEYHTNAHNGSSRGSLTFYSETAGSLKLGQAVHGEIIGGIAGLGKTIYKNPSEVPDPQSPDTWRDRGTQARPSHISGIEPKYLPKVPTILLETSFHDNEADGLPLKDPSFNQMLGRAVLQGIVKFFAERDGTPPIFLPGVPREVSAKVTGASRVTVSWTAPATSGGGPAQGYRIYQSLDGVSFTEVAETAGTSHPVTLSGVKAGAPVFFRVAAVNDAGVSRPSLTVAVGNAQQGKATVLLVGGFDRVDGASPRLMYHTFNPVHDTRVEYGEFERMWMDRINDGSYLITPATALARLGLPFDTAHHSALKMASAIAAYPVVLWHAGNGVSRDAALSASAVSILSQALGGTKPLTLLISGSTVARQLAGGGSDASSLLAKLGVTGQAPTGLAPTSISFASTGPLGPMIEEGIGGITIRVDKSLGLSENQYVVPEVSALTLASGASSIGTFGLYQSPHDEEVNLEDWHSGPAGAFRKQGASCAALLGYPMEAIAGETKQAVIAQLMLQACGVAIPTPLPEGEWRSSSALGDEEDSWLPADQAEQGLGCQLTPGGTSGSAMTLLPLLLGLSLLARRRRERRLSC